MQYMQGQGTYLDLADTRRDLAEFDVPDFQVSACCKDCCSWDVMIGYSPQHEELYLVCSACENMNWLNLDLLRG